MVDLTKDAKGNTQTRIAAPIRITVVQKEKISEKKFNRRDCRYILKGTEKISIKQRKKEFENFQNVGSYEARCAILQGSIIESKKKTEVIP